MAWQCYEQSIPDWKTLQQEVSAREQKRNAAVVNCLSAFATADIRVNLKRHSPILELL